MGSSGSIFQNEQRDKIKEGVTAEFNKCHSEHVSEEDTNERVLQVFKGLAAEFQPDMKFDEVEVVTALRKEYQVSNAHRRKSLKEILHGEPSIPVRQVHKPPKQSAAPGIFSDPFKHTVKKLKKLSGRRRSFDAAQAVGKEIPSSLTSISHTQSNSQDVLRKEKEGLVPEACTPEEHPEIDHWDSVYNQPFCKVCHMHFKTLQMLRRHEEFSELHAINTGKREKACVEASNVVASYVDGVDFKLIYYGTKFFWKSHNSFEIHFFHHIPVETVEIVVNDIETKFELSRIYLDYKIIHSVVKESVESAVDAQIHDKLGHDKFAHDDEAEHEALRIQLLNKAVVEYILKRLHEAEHEFQAPAPSDDIISAKAVLEPPSELSSEPQQQHVEEAKKNETEKSTHKHPEKHPEKHPAFGPQSLHVEHHDVVSYLEPEENHALEKRRYVDYLHNRGIELKHGNHNHTKTSINHDSKTEDKSKGQEEIHSDTHELLQDEERKFLEEIFKKKPKTKGVIFEASLVDSISALLDSWPEKLQPVPVEIHVPIAAFISEGS